MKTKPKHGKRNGTINISSDNMTKGSNRFNSVDSCRLLRIDCTDQLDTTDICNLKAYNGVEIHIPASIDSQFIPIQVKDTINSINNLGNIPIGISISAKYSKFLENIIKDLSFIRITEWNPSVERQLAWTYRFPRHVADPKSNEKIYASEEMDLNSLMEENKWEKTNGSMKNGSIPNGSKPKSVSNGSMPNGTKHISNGSTPNGSILKSISNGSALKSVSSDRTSKCVSSDRTSKCVSSDSTSESVLSDSTSKSAPNGSSLKETYITTNGHIKSNHTSTSVDVFLASRRNRRPPSSNPRGNGRTLQQTIRHRRDISLSFDVKSPPKTSSSSNTSHIKDGDFLKLGISCLIITWILFIVGMGSILDIWTPKVTITTYEEYEDETGLPIPGYYFSMSMLSIVIIWIWCISSWTGMKFFRHSKGGD